MDNITLPAETIFDHNLTEEDLKRPVWQRYVFDRIKYPALLTNGFSKNQHFIRVGIKASSKIL